MPGATIKFPHEIFTLLTLEALTVYYNIVVHLTALSLAI